MSMKNEFETKKKRKKTMSPAQNDIREIAVAEIACVYSNAFT